MVVAADRSTGLTILYRDADIVVVDKPVGVAAHPSPGWTGPTVLGALAGLGIWISTSGAAGAAGHRAPAGRRHHRGDGGGAAANAPTPCSRTRSGTAPSRRSTTRVVQGHPDPERGHHRRADRPAPVVGLEVRRGRRRPGQRHPLRDARGVPVGQPAARCTWRPAAPTRSGCTSRPPGIPCVGDRTYGADPTLAARLGLTRQWLHARSLAFAHPADGRWVEFTSPYPADLAHALEVLAR